MFIASWHSDNTFFSRSIVLIVCTAFSAFNLMRASDENPTLMLLAFNEIMISAVLFLSLSANISDCDCWTDTCPTSKSQNTKVTWGSGTTNTLINWLIIYIMIPILVRIRVVWFYRKISFSWWNTLILAVWHQPFGGNRRSSSITTLSSSSSPASGRVPCWPRGAFELDDDNRSPYLLVIGYCLLHQLTTIFVNYWSCLLFMHANEVLTQPIKKRKDFRNMISFVTNRSMYSSLKKSTGMPQLSFGMLGGIFWFW